MECKVKQDHHDIHEVFNTAVGALNRIWGKVGFDENVQKNRLATAILHVKNLMEQMVKEEEALIKRLERNIEVLRVKLDTLCDELSVSYIKLPDNLTIMKEEQMLRSKVEALKTEKDNRMDRYNELHGKDDALCEVLAEIPYYVPSGSVPSVDQLKELETHVNRMQVEKDKRSAEFNDLKAKICALYNEMETDPETSFANDVVCEDADTFTLSNTKMTNLRKLYEELDKKNRQMANEVDDLWDRLTALWNRLETPEIEREAFTGDKNGHGTKLISDIKAEIAACEELKLQNIHKFIQGIRTELISWWDKTFFDPGQRKSFTQIYEDNFTESLLEAHEKELEKVRDYYNEHRDIIERVSRREELFKVMVEFDAKASDPNRFFNDRGGKLLQEEKLRKKIVKDLPKMEEEVIEFIAHWEKTNNKEFYVNGLKFPNYIIRQKEDFFRHKEHEKHEKMKARAKQTQEEIMFGSKSSLATPGKKKLGGPTTPMRTPLKARKLNTPAKTPNTTSRLPANRIHHSTLLHSPMLTSKNSMAGSNKKRRSIRLMKKSATERRSSNSKRRRSRDVFSHTTVSSDNNTTASLASSCSYNEFANGLSRPHCRSSVVPSTPLTGLRR